MRKDVTPKNSIMIGTTGVGKTEIARRLAQLVGGPFFKVEATKYTEVGYHALVKLKSHADWPKMLLQGQPLNPHDELR